MLNMPKSDFFVYTSSYYKEIIMRSFATLVPYNKN